MHIASWWCLRFTKKYANLTHSSSVNTLSLWNEIYIQIYPFWECKCLTTIAFILFLLQVASKSSGASSDDESERQDALATHINTLACFNDSLNCWLIPTKMTFFYQLQFTLHFHLCAQVFHLLKCSAKKFSLLCSLHH